MQIVVVIVWRIYVICETVQRFRLHVVCMMVVVVDVVMMVGRRATWIFFASITATVIIIAFANIRIYGVVHVVVVVGVLTWCFTIVVVVVVVAAVVLPA